MILYNHVQASQSAHTKSTVHLCGIYSNNNNNDYYYYYFFFCYYYCSSDSTNILLNVDTPYSILELDSYVG